MSEKMRKRKAPQATDCSQNTAGCFSTEPLGMDLQIRKVETSKDKIAQPPLAKDDRKIIPPLGSSIIICGKSGSGKSTLLQNLVTDPRFYGKSELRPNGWFDKIFIFSPTAGTDDVLRALGIPSKHVFTDLSEAPELLKVIQDSQARKLDGGKKANVVEQFLVIFEDCIGETQFMNTKEFKKMFYMVRHLNCTTAISTQHYTRVPKVCRLQASFIFFFAGSAAEVDIIVEDFAPPLYTKREFISLVHDATKGDHSFLTICMKVGWRYRFRKNLDEFIHLTRLDGEDEVAKPEQRPKEEEKPEEKTQKEARFYEDPRKLEESYQVVIGIRTQRDGSDEQTKKVFGEWAHQGARGRTIW